MAPTKKSRSVNKISSPTAEISPSKDGKGDNAKKSLLKRKLSDMLGPKWSDEDMTHFYQAYRKCGKNWEKVASAVKDRTAEMVEALYTMNRAYLSLPEGEWSASVVGLIAMMTYHYCDLEKLETCVRNDSDGFYNPKIPILSPGMKFKDFKEFKTACNFLAIINQWAIKFDPNDKRRVKCICTTNRCSFFIRTGAVKKKEWKKSNRDSRPIEIKSHDFNHTCDLASKNVHFTSRWISDMLIPELSEHLDDLRERLESTFGYGVDKMKAWRAKDLRRKAVADKRNGSSICSRFSFNLNSPTTSTDEVLSSSNELQLGPITPDQIKGQASDESNLDTHIARHMQSSEDTLMRAEADSQHNEQQSGLVLNMLELQEKHSPDKADSEESNTPQKKRRRKNPQQDSSKETTGEREYIRRNKVGEPPGTSSDKVNNMTIQEGQLPSSREIQSAKRKAVRRNQVNKPTPNPAEEGTVDPQKISRPRRSCRRSLNFDLESRLSDGNSSHWPSSTVEDLHENQSHSSVHLGKGIEATTEKTELGNEISRGPSKIIFSNIMLDKQASFLEMIPKSPNSSNCRRSSFLILETPERALKRRHPVRTDESELYSTDVKGVHTRGMHAIYKRKRTEKRHLQKEKGHLSATYYTKPFTCETNSLSLSQCCTDLLQATTSANDETNNIMGNPELVPAFMETWGLRKRRSRCISMVHDLASPPLEICKHFPTPPVKEATVSKFGERDENLDQSNTCMEALVDNSTSRNKFQAEKPLVIYQIDGSSVPFAGSSHRKPRRLNVDIDDKIASVPKILLQDINGEGIDDTNERKNTWWEGEHGLFHGRVESFVVQMRLVQGNRQFSPWKGSVVDSVVGVFLTQNVSDHLSSSAFMSLAARFPLKSKIHTEKHEERTGIIIEEPEVSALDPDDTFGWHDDQSTQRTPGKAVHSSESSKNSTNCTSSTGNSTSQQPGSTESLCVQHESTMYRSTTANAATFFSGDPVEPDDLLSSQNNCKNRERTSNTMDSLDWEAVRCADVTEIAQAIRERGMYDKLAERIKDFLNLIFRKYGSIDLEWLRDSPPEKTKEYLLKIKGLGLKSTECVRLLTLYQRAFPVDTNVARIAVRLGWVPLQPLPKWLQLHLLEEYPVLDSIQKYLWPRLCRLDQRILYELHYHMITFGKVFCTKSKPNCNACPMRGECKHFASAFASARLGPPEEKSIVTATEDKTAGQNPFKNFSQLSLPLPQANQTPFEQTKLICSAPIIEVPATPRPEQETSEIDIEDAYFEDPNVISTVKSNIADFTQNVKNFVENNVEFQQVELAKALVALTPETASIPMPKLKHSHRLRAEHQVYELPDSHPLLNGFDKREPDDPSPYLLAIWTPGETAESIQPPGRHCNSQETGRLCDHETCFACNSIHEAHSQKVRGTLLVPCRSAMRGSFPLNGTYFQVNEVFADHQSSLYPIDVPRDWLWDLPRRTVYFGTSIRTIFKGLTTESTQHCFWRGFVCVRGFDRKTGAPRPLLARWRLKLTKD